MRHRLAFTTVVAVLGTLAAARPASACSCMYPGPVCQAYWNVDAVFDATVLDISAIDRAETVGGHEYRFQDKLVQLQVHRSWKGAQPGPLEVTTASDEAGCGFDFKVGERYLVFAHRGRTGPHLAVSICNHTRRFDGTGPAAEFLASLDGPPGGGRVFGSVTTTYRLFGDGGPVQETKTETTVRLVGGGTTRTVRSTGGKYEFGGLDEGPYRVEVETPAGHRVHATTVDVGLANRRACAEANFRFSPAGRIAGRLVGGDGRPLPSVRVEYTSVDSRPHPDYGLQVQATSTDTDGFFELEHVPPGRFIMGVNLSDLPTKYNPYARTTYPGAGSDPAVLEIALGQTVDIGTWHMPPPLPVVRIEGIVVRPDGTPVTGVYVGAWDRTGNPVETARGAGGARSGPDGRFTLELRRGRSYEFSVRGAQHRMQKIQAPRLESASEKTPLIRIVLLGA